MPAEKNSISKLCHFADVDRRLVFMTGQEQSFQDDCGQSLGLVDHALLIHSGQRYENSCLNAGCALNSRAERFCQDSSLRRKTWRSKLRIGDLTVLPQPVGKKPWLESESQSKPIYPKRDDRVEV